MSGIDPKIELVIERRMTALRDELRRRQDEREKALAAEIKAGFAQLNAALSEQGVELARLSHALDEAREASVAELASAEASIEELQLRLYAGEGETIMARLVALETRLVGASSSGGDLAAVSRPDHPTLPPAPSAEAKTDLQLQLSMLSNRTKVLLALIGALTVLLPPALTLLTGWMTSEPQTPAPAQIEQGGEEQPEGVPRDVGPPGG